MCHTLMILSILKLKLIPVEQQRLLKMPVRICAICQIARQVFRSCQFVDNALRCVESFDFGSTVANMAIREVNDSIALILIIATQHLNIPAQRPTWYTVKEMCRGPLLCDSHWLIIHCPRSIHLWLRSHPSCDTGSLSSVSLASPGDVLFVQA